MKKITKRDVLFFFLGIFAFFLFESVYNWEETKDAVKKGYIDGHESTAKFNP